MGDDRTVNGRYTLSFLPDIFKNRRFDDYSLRVVYVSISGTGRD